MSSCGTSTETLCVWYHFYTVQEQKLNLLKHLVRSSHMKRNASMQQSSNQQKWSGTTNISETTDLLREPLQLSFTRHFHLGTTEPNTLRWTSTFWLWNRTRRRTKTKTDQWKRETWITCCICNKSLNKTFMFLLKFSWVHTETSSSWSGSLVVEKPCQCLEGADPACRRVCRAGCAAHFNNVS